MRAKLVVIYEWDSSCLTLQSYHYASFFRENLCIDIEDNKYFVRQNGKHNFSQASQRFIFPCTKTAIESKESDQITITYPSLENDAPETKKQRAIAVDSQLNPEKPL
uniref:Uncharacterized protein n=1 Tax=Parascaris equorum TaxID=6256 RepID=A0A914RCW2_PAREQ